MSAMECATPLLLFIAAMGCATVGGMFPAALLDAALLIAALWLMR